jgi:hypothetical protein
MIKWTFYFVDQGELSWEAKTEEEDTSISLSFEDPTVDWMVLENSSNGDQVFIPLDKIKCVARQIVNENIERPKLDSSSEMDVT